MSWLKFLLFPLQDGMVDDVLDLVKKVFFNGDYIKSLLWLSFLMNDNRNKCLLL